MNSDFLKTLDAFDNATSSRRDVIRKAGHLGANAALAALPFFASARSTMAKTYGFNPEEDIDILNFALTLEYLEYYFYIRAVGGILNEGEKDEMTVSPELSISGDVRPLFEEIRDNEAAHVTVLTATIESLNDTDKPAAVSFELDDFTYEVEGMSVYEDYDLFLTLAQGFEDTGVRAYKGQAALIDAPGVLTAALQIHSVEARHAAAVRRLRGLQGWIPFDQPGVDAAIAATYDGEENTTQGDVELVGSLGGAYTAEEITEAFDETLTRDEVLNITRPFGAG